MCACGGGGGGGGSVCGCVVRAFVKCPTLPLCAVDGCSRDPLYYYYYCLYFVILAAQSVMRFVSSEPTCSMTPARCSMTSESTADTLFG